MNDEIHEEKLKYRTIENDLNKLNEELYARKSYFSDIESEKKLLSERKHNIENDLTRFERNLNANSEDREKINLEIEKENSDLTLIKNEAERLANEIEVKEKDYLTQFDNLKEAEKNIREYQEKYYRTSNSLIDFKGKIDGAYINLDSLSRREEQLKEEKSRIADRLKQKNSDEEIFTLKLETVNKAGEALVEAVNKLDFDKARELKNLSDCEKKYYEIKTDIDKNKSRIKVLEEMEKEHGGFSKAVKMLIHDYIGDKKGMCGVVADLINVQKEYVTAAEVALGQALQNVVVETEEDAKKYIEYLKDQKGGRATFLPISTISGRNFSADEKNRMKITGFIGVGSDLITTSPKYVKILESLLGRTVFMDNMNNAIILARKTNNSFRIVTLAGEVINAGGSITGGSLHATGNSFLSRKAEIEELKELTSKKIILLEKTNKELENINHEIEKIVLEKETTGEELQNTALELNTIKHKLEAVTNEKLVIIDRISISDKEMSEIKSDTEEIENNILVLKEKLTEAETNKANLEILIEKSQIEQKNMNESKDKFNHELTLLKLKQNSNSHKLEATQQSIDKHKLGLEDIKAEDDFIIQELNQSKVQLEETELNINKHSEILAAGKDEIAEADKFFGETDKNKREVQSKIDNLEIKIEKMRETYDSTQAIFHKVEMQLTKVEAELEAFELRLMEQYDINVFLALQYKDDTISLSFASKRISELKEEIKEMGSVNVNAVEEFEALKERYTFLNKQITDLEAAIIDLEKIISDLTDSMKVQFMEEFVKINNNFDIVFKKLFAGGEARIELSDTENVLESGIEIIVRPPGKKLQNLSLWSGGERALTAIALLFAILMIKPAPFCLLDEIDAALDDANVDKYANFLKEFASETQFIIVTHRKGTMEVADCLYGVTMEESGVSRLVSVKLEEKHVSGLLAAN